MVLLSVLLVFVGLIVSVCLLFVYCLFVLLLFLVLVWWLLACLELFVGIYCVLMFGLMFTVFLVLLVLFLIFRVWCLVVVFVLCGLVGLIWWFVGIDLCFLRLIEYLVLVGFWFWFDLRLLALIDVGFWTGLFCFWMFCFDLILDGVSCLEFID